MDSFGGALGDPPPSVSLAPALGASLSRRQDEDQRAVPATGVVPGGGCGLASRPGGWRRATWPPTRAGPVAGGPHVGPDECQLDRCVECLVPATGGTAGLGVGAAARGVGLPGCD